MKKGAAHTEQARLKISEKMSGRTLSDSTRERMAFARTVWWAKERQRRKELKERLANEYARHKANQQVEVEPARSVTESFDSRIAELTAPLGN